MKPLLAIFLLLFIAPAHAQGAPPVAQVRAGELRLEGRIEKIDGLRLTITAVAFVNSSAKRGTITPPKTKNIVLPAQGAPTNLKVGDEVAVTGSDGGTGQPLLAGEIAILSRIELEAPVPSPETQAVPPQPEPLPAKVPVPLAPDAFSAPLEWKAGAYYIRVAEAGFNYTTRFLPQKLGATDRTPVFYAVFEVRGGPKEKISSLFALRRVVGPRGEIVVPNDSTVRNLPPQGDTARFVFWDDTVSPLWAFADLDVDTTFGETNSGVSEVAFTLENITLPPIGGEISINQEQVSAFGTKYRAHTLRCNKKGQFTLAVTQQKLAISRDLQVISYSYRADGSGASGDFYKSKGPAEEHDFPFSVDPRRTEIKKLVIRLSEFSRQSQTRDGIKRQRVRFPLQELLKRAAPAPPDKPLPVLAQSEAGGVSIKIEPEGVTWGENSASMLLFAQGSAEEVKRGMEWFIENGRKRAPGQNDSSFIGLPGPSKTQNFLWHADATPLSEGETSRRARAFELPPGTQKFDLELYLQGRFQMISPFERTLALPSGHTPLTLPDDEEGTLILRKLQRFPSPDGLAAFPDWARPESGAGLVLLLETNPQLDNSNCILRCFDAEDNQGRPLQIDTDRRNLLMRDAKKPEGPRQLYALKISDPAPTAKSITLWFSTEEQSPAARRQTIQIKDVPVWTPK